MVAEGETLELWMGDRPLLRLTDRTFVGPGKVALWTKADAATLFDDVGVTPYRPVR